jgi:peptide subunit release factor 1 (eRF1)
MKKCAKCGIEKSIDQFGFDIKRPDFKNVYCKKCNSENSKISYRKTVERNKKRYQEIYGVPYGDKRGNELP